MQRGAPIVIGIDAGTTSVKSVAFTTDGAILSVARSSVHLLRGRHGEVEADMEDIWRAAVTTLTAVLDETGAAEVLAVGITGQGDGAWLVDDDGHPLRPAALWLDGRATDALNEWTGDGRAAAVSRATGSPLFSGALPLLLDALAPELDALPPETGIHQLNCKDWLRYRLTGAMLTDPSEASRTFYDTAQLGYSTELMATLGQERFASILATVADPAAVGGVVTAEASRETGLPAGIPVAVGMVDTAAAGVGLGAINDGDGYAILGTTGFVGINRSSRAELATDDGIILATGRRGQVIESLTPMTGTPNLDWVRKTLGLDSRSWTVAETDARTVPPGSGGVLYLPYASPSGERAPFVDVNASAAWLGMSVTTSASQLLRSVYEGLAYSLAECIDLVNPPGSLTICGGGSDSDLFCEILADVTGRRIERQDAPEVGARGSAALALVAVGVADSLEAAVRQLVPATTAFEPDAERAAIYRRSYRAFLSTRDALRPTWPALRELRNS